MFCDYKDNMWATSVLISKSLNKYVSENVKGTDTVKDKKRYHLVVLLAVVGRQTKQLSEYGPFANLLDKLPDSCSKECYRQLLNEGCQETSTLNRIVEDLFNEVGDQKVRSELSCSNFNPFFNPDNKKNSGTITPLILLWYIDMVNLAVVSFRRSFNKDDFTDLNLWPLNNVFKVSKVNKLFSIVPIDPRIDDNSFGNGNFPFDAFNASDNFSSNRILGTCFRKINDPEGNRKARESMSSDKRAAVLCKFLKAVTMSDAAAGIETKHDNRGAKNTSGMKRREPDQSAEGKEEVEGNAKKAKKAKNNRRKAKGNGKSEKKPKAESRKKKSSSTSVAGVVTEGTAESTTSRKCGPSLSEQFVNKAMRQTLKQQHPKMSEAEMDEFVKCFKNSYKTLEQTKLKESGEEEDEEPNKRGTKRSRFILNDTSDSSEDDIESSGDDSSGEDGSSGEDESSDGSDSDSEMELLDVEDVIAIEKKLIEFELYNYGTLTLKNKKNGCARPTMLYAETLVQGIMGEKHSHRENRKLYNQLMNRIEENYIDNNKNDENVRTIINSAKIKGYSAKVVIYEIDQKKNNEWEWTSISPIIIGDEEGKNVVNIMRHIKNGKTIGYYTLTTATKITSQIRIGAK